MVDNDDVEAIQQVKFAYLRLLDLKRFDALGELLTPDCTASYDDGKLSFTGRPAIVEFLTGALGDPGTVTQHHCHHPEIVLGSRPATTATGTWYLEDRVIVPAHDFELRGTAFYHDRYTKDGGRWLISHTGYERVYEEQRSHSTMALTSFTSRFAGGGTPGGAAG
jgi:ketosteroid isomerase-like protein